MLFIPFLYPCKYFHCLPSAAHSGIMKTVTRISHSYWWPNHRAEITEMVKRCHLCQITKPRNTLSPGILSSRIESVPWERLYIDFVGPLPRSKRGYCYIFTVVDGFTKMSFLEPVRDASSSSAINVLDTQNPWYLIMPLLLELKYSKICVSRMVLSIYLLHHTTLVPILRREFIEIFFFALTAFTQENHATWDQFLGDLSIAFNTAMHEGTGYTPCKPFFGRDISHPLNNVWKVPISIADDTTSETKLAAFFLARLNFLWISGIPSEFPCSFYFGDKLWRRGWGAHHPDH
ncbi:hypothetical protein J437_LFUL010120 [Ladona fulva]|uniref:RNA-directed DNA polymerase n=1 Tax=Ladona fulva TaxID=123851 RepID=A0A8K0KLM6_LADFU|nr:hypothetical protein J437_LFUL010120 [Ladona fulva]